MKILIRVLFYFLLSTLFWINNGFASTLPPLKPLTLVLDWYVNPDHAPLFVAQQQGFFKQQGLKVTFISPSDPNDPPKLVAAGKADLAITYQPQLLLQVSEGLPLVRIATLVATPLSCIAVSEKSTIHTMADLKGKTIGYSTPINETTIAAMLAQHQLSLQDVKLINVRFNLVQALLSGKVDAVAGVMRNVELIEMQLAQHPARAFYPEENGIPTYDELIIVTNRHELHDPRLPRFLAALNQGTQYLVNHPEESWQLFAKNHPELNNELNKRSWFATLPRFSLDPAALDPSRYQNLAIFLQKNHLIKNVPPVASYAVALAY